MRADRAPPVAARPARSRARGGAGCVRSLSRPTGSPPPGDLGVLARREWADFAAAVRADLGATRWYSAIVRAVFDPAADPATVGVLDQRAGALERVRFVNVSGHATT
jgi:hypothetical protein